MVTIQNPTSAFSTVVARRRRSRAAPNGEVFRLGVHGLNCSGPSQQATPRAVIGASNWALKAERVEETLETIGIVGGLLADLGYQVCPVGADADRAQPTLVLWVCGDETEADEYEQLAAIGVAGLSIGSCVYGLDGWSYIDAAELEDRATFIRRVVTEVGFLRDGLVGENVSNNLSNEPRRTGPDDGGRTVAETAPDLHRHGRRRTTADPPGRRSSGS